MEKTTHSRPAPGGAPGRKPAAREDADVPGAARPAGAPGAAAGAPGAAAGAPGAAAGAPGAAAGAPGAAAGLAEARGAAAWPQPPALEFAFELHAEVADPTVVGELQTGTRRIIDILGGTFEGPRVRGRLLPGGADWQLIRADGFTEVDARYTLETDSGRLIYVTNVGIRHAAPEVMRKLNAGEPVDAAAVYFRGIPRFETAAPELEWLMRSIFVSTGERYPNGVIIRYFRLL